MDVKDEGSGWKSRVGERPMKQRVGGGAWEDREGEGANNGAERGWGEVMRRNRYCSGL